MTATVLRLPAIEVRQGRRRIYCFAVDGKLIDSFTAVSRVRRDDDAQLHGYQRPEALAHVRAIRRYVESAGAVLPNALVLAFDQRVTFTPSITVPPEVDYSVPGELLIPVDPDLAEHERPAWLVDGQQRAAAIRDANVTAFPVATVGFIADTVAEQRAQFILVNSTKPLPTGLIHELLPATTGALPAKLARRRLPADVMARLNQAGPFAGLIASPTARGGYIKDTSVLKMLEHALYHGCLYQYRNPADGSGDMDRIVRHLNLYWSAVRDTWPDAWARPPRESRLTHGVGIQAMGYVMDSLTETTAVEHLDPAALRTTLAVLDRHTAWTSGTWRLGRQAPRRWNALQNLGRDIADLVDHLLGRLESDADAGDAA